MNTAQLKNWIEHCWKGSSRRSAEFFQFDNSDIRPLGGSPELGGLGQLGH